MFFWHVNRWQEICVLCHAKTLNVVIKKSHVKLYIHNSEAKIIPMLSYRTISNEPVACTRVASMHSTISYSVPLPLWYKSKSEWKRSSTQKHSSISKDKNASCEPNWEGSKFPLPKLTILDVDFREEDNSAKGNGSCGQMWNEYVWAYIILVLRESLKAYGY